MKNYLSDFNYLRNLRIVNYLENNILIVPTTV